MTIILPQMTEKSMPKSQRQRVLERFQAGEKLTVRKIFNEMKINSPTKVISDLRAKGYNIKDYEVQTEHSFYKVYYLGEVV